jgi:hypothetical protein
MLQSGRVQAQTGFIKELPVIHHFGLRRDYVD